MMHRNTGTLILILAFCAIGEPLVGQDRIASAALPTVSDNDISLLDRPAGLKVEGVPLGEALTQMGYATGVGFAFSPSLIPVDKRVSCDCRFISIRETLDRLLNGTGLRYAVLGDQVVVERARIERPRLPSLPAIPAERVTFTVAAIKAAPRAGFPTLQTGTIAGQVIDAATNRPLSGVQVTVVGTGRGALTDASGNFSVTEIPAGSGVVRAQMIGYRTAETNVEVRAGETLRVDLLMTQTAIALDEIVVTGTAGLTRRRAIGNVVTAVSAPEVVDRVPVGNVTQLLQGRSPGVTIIQPAGTAGTAASIRIRGASSVTAGNRPVFYVDGVRIEAGGQGAFNVGGQTTSALDAISPESIESIEVIKGPAAATLYGAEAAGGVIQIITKQGRAGEQSTQWTAKVDLGRTDWHLPIRDNYTVCTPARIAGAHAPTASAFPGCAGLDPLAPVEDRIITHNPLRDDGVLRDGLIQAYAVSARGGGDHHGFYVAVDRHDEEGVFSNNHFNRTSVRGNFTVWATDQLDFGANVHFSRNNARLPQNDNASYGWLRNAYRGLPGQRGQYAMGWRGLGPEQMASYDNRETSDRVIGGVTVNYQPFSWFRNRLIVGLDAGERLGTLFYAIDRTGTAPFGVARADGQIIQNTRQVRRYSVDYGGTISNDLRPELTSALSFGVNLNMRSRRTLEAQGDGLVSDYVRTVSSANITMAHESFSEQNSLGFYVQEQLGWQDRLFLTGAIRVDDNSAFGEDFSTVIYPKLSAAWVISEEPFFHLPGIDDFRIRMAWGQAGNAPTPFSADRTYRSATVVTQDGQRLESALEAWEYGNPDLHAERGSELEFGFEGSLLNGRAGVDVTYYNSNTYDALVPVTVAPSSGFTGSVLENIGHVRNRGIEMALFGTPVRNPTVVWDIRTSLATNRNELVDWGGGRDDFIGLGWRNSQRHDVGYPLAGYWAEELLRNPDGSLALGADGRPTFGEFQYIGPSVPTIEAALVNTVTLFGRLTLHGLLDYQGGHYLLEMNGQRRARDENTWRVVNPEVTEEEILIAKYGGPTSDIHPADFLKLREISATYDIPTRWTRRTGAERMSITLAGRNLNTWTRFAQADPEVNIAGDDEFRRGDSNSVPGLRQLVATINVRF